MTYLVTYTETTNPAKVPITVADQTLNTQTSITFVGKNYAGYAPVMATNMLHMLENFAGPGQPNNPVQGQLWYDNINNLLKVFDGAGNWNAAGSVKKGASAPLVASSTAGDIWVDTTNSQLYLFSGSNWLLVGPQYSTGTLTGPQVENIVDTNNTSHSVITFYSNNSRISIISKDTFTPKATINGFTSIKQGVNLSEVDSTLTTNPTRFYGTATTADALLVNNVAVAATNFLRSNAASVGDYPLSIRNDGGLTVGSNLSFNIGTNGTSAIFLNKTSGSPIDFQLNNAGTTTTVLHLSSNGKIGVGTNNTNPSATLDVAGSLAITSGLTDTGTTNSKSVGTGSIITAGGISIAKNISVGGTSTLYGNLVVNNLDLSSVPTAGAVIQPGSDSAANLYDIGTSTRPFRNIYAQTFVGAFNGTFSGSLSGSITGAAARLASATAFSITGDVTSNTISFDGQTGSGTAVFTTTINQGIISAKVLADDTQLTDQFLIYRPGTGLLSATKSTILNHVATMPVGVIMPYAGAIPPTGYLFCDGSEVKIGDFSALFNTIGYAYKAAVLLQGQNTFALPDLRGRFALGADNMNNGRTVPYKDGSGQLVSAGGGTANRVTDITADTLGAGSGSQTVTLSVSNLPDHKHNMATDVAQYYAAGLPGASSDPNAVPGLGLPSSSTGSGLPNSGSVIAGTTGAAVTVMNPYATVNYIIFTGVL